MVESKHQREKRLADALRENLKRRKAQARDNQQAGGHAAIGHATTGRKFREKPLKPPKEQ